MAEIGRRDALRLLGAAGLTGVVGACSSSSGTKKAHSATSTTTSTTTTTAAPTITAPATSAPGTDPKAVNWDALSAKLTRPLVRPGAADYAGDAQLYNPRFDASSQPQAIATCTGPTDVAACIAFATDQGVPFAMRSGGHSYGGWSTSPGLVVDTGRMADIAVDPTANTARIGAGARLVDVYTKLGAAGRAIGAGSCPTVGITGLTLGGGVGVLSPSFGLTCDQLKEVEIVTADGKVRTANGGVEPDLFWAMRGGGGGSFGAVTALTFELRPAPTVTTFYLEWDFQVAGAVLGAWQQWLGGAPRELWSTCKLLGDGSNRSLRAVVAGTWTGDPGGLDARLAPLRNAVGTAPRTATSSTLGYVDAMLFEAGCQGQSAEQCRADAVSPAKRQAFAATSSVVTAALPASAVSVTVEQVRSVLNLGGLIEGGVSFDALGGKVAEVAPTDSAFVHRHALATLQYTATYNSSDPAPFDDYVHGFRQALAPTLGNAAYVNYIDPLITDYGQAYWGTNYARLQQVKRTYDPHRVFDFPQAVQPA